jgi:hypothetical protein
MKSKRTKTTIEARLGQTPGPDAPAAIAEAKHPSRKGRLTGRKQRELLAQRLLAIGGTRVHCDGMPDPTPILARGELFHQPVRKWQCEKRECHANAARLWGRYFDHFRLATGYALADGGDWIQHSWLLDEDRGALKATLYETTYRMRHYFGYVLDLEESLRFWAVGCLCRDGSWPLQLLSRECPELAALVCRLISGTSPEGNLEIMRTIGAMSPG